jgi:uncharacterized protein YjiS (DUF1127 family)
MVVSGHPSRSVPAAPVSCRGALVSSLAEITAVLGAWRARYRYRRELRRLMSSGRHLIEDIGLLRAHAEREAAKPFWRP